MTARVSPGLTLPPTGRPSSPFGSLHSIRYNDEAVVVEDVGSKPLEMDEETKWIRAHIKKKQCSQFIPAPNKAEIVADTLIYGTPEANRVYPDETAPKGAVSSGSTLFADMSNHVTMSEERLLCQCGFVRSEHAREALRKNALNEKWSDQQHTRPSMTNAFGELEFVGYGGNIAKYIRVDEDSSMSDMLQLMMKVWGMDKPNLLISVTGGAKNFQMSKRLKETFRRGLMKTALTTGAWIITGGTHAGVMKHVGEAVKDFGLASTSQNPVISIGIAPWGCVQNKQALEQNDCTGLWPAQYRIEKEQRPKESFLDPNHSHFILVDNGTQHKFGVEIDFRAKLENQIAQIRTDTGENAVSVPIVLLVLEGGPGTMKTVTAAIQTNTPAVIVKGSGRAADILAYAYLNSKEVEVEALDKEGNKHKVLERQLEDKIYSDVLEMLEKEFGVNEAGKNMDRIKICLSKCDLMSVFELDNKGTSSEIDVAMLQALLKANKNQVMDQLKLALAWNRIDVAKSDIFTDEKRWPTGSLDDVMLSAIMLNRVDFIELFLDHGVSLREFITIKRLLVLYNKIPPNCLLRSQLSRIKDREDHQRRNFSLLDVGLLMQELIGDYYQARYTTQERYACVDADMELDGVPSKRSRKFTLSATMPKSKRAMSIGNNGTTTYRGGQVQQYDFENPAQELFLWAVLNQRQDMAKLFWAEGKDAIAAALVANSLLRAMKKKTDDTELELQIQEHVDEWSNLAIGVLSECHSTDEHKVQDLLVRELNHWGNSTCMLIAVKADNKDFISQTACQSLLNRIWMGKMSQENNTAMLLLCLFMPPLALWLVKFNIQDLELRHNKHLQEYELNSKNMKDGEDKPFRRQKTFSRNKTDNSLGFNPRGSRQSLQADDATDEQTRPVVKQLYTISDQFYHFFNAPVVIFMYNVLSYLVFLALFTYILIFNFKPKVSSAEIVLMIWVFTIFTEEIRQIATTSASTLGTKLQSYITDTWNIVDIVTISLFLIGMVLRFLPYESTFEAGRVFLALNFVSFFLRLLHIFSVHKELGPKLVMIGRMIQDLMYFVVILMVFVISYAIASHSILFPNSPVTWNTINAIVRRSYWNIYGELFLEEIEGEENCTFDENLWLNGTYSRCPTDVGRHFVPILMGVYMLLANVLLLNLLIAMFSYTFQMVQDNTDKHWFYQRYSLIYEYYTRPILCPPFIFFAHVYLLVKFLVQSCCMRQDVMENGSDDDDDFRRKFKNERELVQWENVIADAFHHKKELTAFDSTDYKVQSTHTKLEILMNRIDEIQEHQHQLGLLGHGGGGQGGGGHAGSSLEPNTPVSPSNVVVKMPPQLDIRLASLEKQMEVTYKSLQWIMGALQKSEMSRGVAPPTIPDLEEEKRREDERVAQLEAARKRKRDSMVERATNLHFRSRTSPYLGTLVRRFPVPDEKVPWAVEFEEYSPPTYTSDEVLSRPDWADLDLLLMSVQGRRNAIAFNSVDPQKCNRVSFLGTYEVVEGLPLNPRGRTGLQGRGSLGRWGPNHAGDPIVTRWKMVDGQKHMKHGKPVLEFVAVMRSDNEMWALPGAIALPGAKPADHLKTEFTEEAMGSLSNEAAANKIQRKLRKLWKKGTKIYEGYADDPRNTDNAWLESTVFSYHDDKNIMQHFNLRAGETVELATWLTASGKLTMHGSHLYFLKMVAEKLGAHF